MAQPPEARLELIDGEFIEKAAPTLDHGRAQQRLLASVGRAFDRKAGGPRDPGGWWIASEVDIALDGRGFRPDAVGWRREREPVLPKGRPVLLRPDWICEIVSDSNASADTVLKMRRYHQAGVQHYWLLDPLARTLHVFRYTPENYVLALAAEAGERVRAEPFDAIELAVSVLLGDDPDDDA